MADSSQLLKQTPGAVKRLGESLFLKAPLYRAKATFIPIYINTALFQRYVSAKTSSWKEISDTVLKLFSVTVDPALATGKALGFAYVDRQHDPLQFATRGNEGSGRAYYLGKHFNMKGEKTPLCTSTNPHYSDGVLTMERGVWEAYISNVLDGDVSMGVPPVLAVLDMGETCYVDRTKLHEKRVRIIRVDDHGALDRITHIFAAKQPLTKKQFVHTAQQFGKQEGEKFAQRIMYGAWSSGNITPNGDMLDFDTVCAVKGRSPQYSASAWHRETYFGYEVYGQLKILEAMTKDVSINKARVSFKELESDCLDAMKTQIAERFLYLAGFEHVDRLYKRHKIAIDALAEDFTSLARMFYPKLSGLSLRSSVSYLFHVLDFSAFFRIYPLLKRTGEFSVEKSLKIMMDSDLLHFPLERQELGWTDKEDLEYFKAHAWETIKRDYISDAGILGEIRRQAGEFIQAYDRLYEHILSRHDINTLDVEARAYVINEDRLYLFPCYTPTDILTTNQAGLSPKQQSEWIEHFIAASKRKPVKNAAKKYQADIRLFKEGIYCTYLNGAGYHQHSLSLFAHIPWVKKFKKQKTAYLRINGKLQKAKISVTDQYVSMATSSMGNEQLVASISKETALTVKTIMVLHEENIYKINDYLEN